MNDEKAIDSILEAFTKALIANKLYDRESFKIVLERVMNLLAAEQAWRMTKNHEKEVMEYWGSTLN